MIQFDKESYASKEEFFSEFRFKINAEFESEIRILKSGSERLKKQFLSESFADLSIGELVYRIKYYYSELVLFPDDAIFSKFKSLGLTESDLRWFTPLDQIIEKFQQIESSNELIVLKNAALECICHHFDTKITAEVVIWGEIKSKKKGQELKVKHELLNLNRRLKYGNGKILRPKNEGDVILQKLIEINNMMLPNLSEKELLSELNGNSEKKYLSELVKSCYDISDQLSESELLRCMYGLFQLIMKDKRLPTSEELVNQNACLGPSRTYQAKIVRKIIYKR